MSKHSSTPWVLCHHLSSPEHDASCSCGYRGGVWSGPDDTILFEMGQTPDFAHDNDKMLPEANRETQLADAAFIVRACNAHDELVDAADEALNTLIGCCIPAGGCDDRQTILDTQMRLRKVLQAVGVTYSDEVMA